MKYVIAAAIAILGFQAFAEPDASAFTSTRMNAAPAIASADFDNDHISDLVVVTSAGLSGSNGAVRFFKGLGAGKFAESVLIDEPSYELSAAGVSITTGDFNNDGCQDIAVAAQSGGIYAEGHILVYLGNCKGHFAKVPSGK